MGHVSILKLEILKNFLDWTLCLHTKYEYTLYFCCVMCLLQIHILCRMQFPIQFYELIHYLFLYVSCPVKVKVEGGKVYVTADEKVSTRAILGLFAFEEHFMKCSVFCNS